MTDGENGRKYAKYADIEAVLSNAQGVAMTDKKKHAGRTLSAAWEAMMQAHDHTTAAVKVREAGLEREFYLIALADLAAVKNAAESEIRRVAAYLVNECNVSSTTVAQQAEVSHTTVQRWAASDRGE
ncbi:hypothetical protein EVU97_14815 [Dermacoccus sp. 147Ba]|uniref:hypothetical protein n=1 Tax=Dermacoccus sp. 147Ba TaxID=2510111 RepID=UPI00101D7E7F|nr:hypothetical protein [Dermacoccus sp. 147Ba]RYI20323.1 hypothetical protein EVU97_14815 [Dermacoccus sp. 147Ba]